MVVGCYALHLYCDVEACTWRGHGEFTGRTEREALAAARKARWRVDMRATPPTAACPHCAPLRGRNKA